MKTKSAATLLAIATLLIAITATPWSSGAFGKTLAASGYPFVTISASDAGGGADAHTCALTKDGKAYCWGNNASGQLGTANITNSDLPVAVAGGYTYTQISADYYHTCGLTKGGQVLCWGSNDNGELGDGNSGTGMYETSPVPVATAATFVQVSAGWTHTCGITKDGHAYCWGGNAVGQLGDGTNLDSNVPVLVAGGLSFTQLISGGGHTCGITKDRQTYCWGGNGLGQLGNGTFDNSNVPIPVTGGHTFSQITGNGGNISCGLTKDGQAFCWGGNFFGQLGDGSFTNSNVPVSVGGGYTFTQLTATGDNACGITKGGDTLCWGFNISGELGNGVMGVSSNLPVLVTGGFLFTQVSTGGFHTCAIAKSNGAYCWGDNSFGEIGDGATVAVDAPTPVSPPAN